MKRASSSPFPQQEVKKDIANPVRFGGPVVAPGVTDPRALQYAAQAQARHPKPGTRPGPGRYVAPVAGGKGPPIPRLDQPADAGLSMADQANMQRAAQVGPPVERSMFTGSAPPSAGAAPIPMSRPPVGILPIDILPEEARQDPDFKEGQGSMYASAQPGLAFKYGVIRNGQRVPPQKLGQASKGLSDKSLKDLETLASLQTGQKKANDDPRIEQDAVASAAGAAGRLGNAPSDGPQTGPAVGREKLTEAVKKLDDFDFNTFREAMMKDILNNEEQREIIEKRCTPLDLTDLVMRGYVRQRVPIIPGKFEPEFQSMPGSEDLAIKRLIMLEGKGLEVSERYLLDKFSMMGVTIGLYAINGNPVPDHHDEHGNFNEEKFWAKFNYVTRFPFHMLGSLGVNYFWFDVRVRKLFVAEKMGNG